MYSSSNSRGRAPSVRVSRHASGNNQTYSNYRSRVPTNTPGRADYDKEWRTQQKLPTKRTSVFQSDPPNRSVLLPRQDIKPGVIIRAPVHQQDYRGASRDSEVTAVQDKYVTKSRFGDIFTKFRKMIVVACYENHYVSIPLFTHNGVGLINKKRPEEYISVRDHRNPQKYAALSKNGILVTKYLSSSVNLYEIASTAHITYPVSRTYNLEATPEGELDFESTQDLIALVEKWAPKPKA